MKLWSAVLAALALVLQEASGAGADEGRAPPALLFRLAADAMLGRWETEGTVSPRLWRPAGQVAINAKLRLTDRHLEAFAAARGARATDAVMLVTAERTFVADGWLRLPIDERMSTLVTPTGLAIEGGVQGAVTRRFGYAWSTPLDLMASRPLSGAASAGGVREVAFALEGDLPKISRPASTACESPMASRSASASRASRAGHSRSGLLQETRIPFPVSARIPSPRPGPRPADAASTRCASAAASRGCCWRSTTPTATEAWSPRRTAAASRFPTATSSPTR